jgi:hypothetical protein
MCLLTHTSYNTTTSSSTTILPRNSNINLSNKMNSLINTLKPYVQLSNMENHKHAAMLFSGGKPLSIGFNHDRNITKKRFVTSYHAEVDCLSKFFDTHNMQSYKRYLNDTERCLSYKRGPRGKKQSSLEGYNFIVE